MICAWLFVPRFLPFIWIAFGVTFVTIFFYFSSIISYRWAEIPVEKFKKKIFSTSLIIRTIYVILIYYFYLSKTGKPFEFESGDSFGYHIEGIYIVDMFFSGKLDEYLKYYIRSFSDVGWPLIIAVIYSSSFKSIIILRLTDALFSSWMVIMIYNTARRNFGERAARITGVMAMLLPAFIFYSGLHLKETTMVFLLMAFIDRADALLHSRNFTLNRILIIVFLGVSLFAFRTVLAVAAWFALFSAFLLSSENLMNKYRKTVIISWLIIAFVVILSSPIFNDISIYLGMRRQNQSTRLEAYSLGEGANRFTSYGRAAIFIPLILPAPFPTLVNIPEQQNIMMSNGDLFTRNVYVFFVFVAIYILFKKKRLRKNLLITVFLGTYLLILANSGFALSPRFHVPALPFLLILAGFGITQTNRNYSSYYMLYLIGISTLIVAWNWFKLAGRGLV